MKEDVLNRLKALPQRLCVAFAAGCAERVLVIFEYNADEDNEPLKKAVELAWNYACQSEVDATIRDRTLKLVERVTPDTEEMGSEYTPSMSAAIAAAYALESTADLDPVTAARAAYSALEAVDAFDEYRGDGLKEEEDWQEKALQVAESRGDKPVARDMFQPIRTAPPAWLRDWI